MDDNKDFLEIVIKAAIKAGEAINKIYDNPDTDFSIEKKADNTPLTVADRKSHQIIQELLEKTNLPILSEEGRTFEFSERKNWERFWLVDPLDGTKEFINRNDEFTVNIALIKQGIPILGVIYIPATKTLYIGEKELGAFKMDGIVGEISLKTVIEKGQKLPLIKKSDNYVIMVSRSHMNFDTEEYIKQLKQKHKNIEIISKGSSLKICLVAEGFADEYPRFGPTMEWDIAAGHAIANAAGKKLWRTDFTGELTYNKENLLNPHFIEK